MHISHLVGCLVVHDQLAIHEVEAVGLGLERVLDHIVYCSQQHTRISHRRSYNDLCGQGTYLGPRSEVVSYRLSPSCWWIQECRSRR